MTSTSDLNALGGMLSNRASTVVLDESIIVHQQVAEDMKKLMTAANVAMDNDAFFVIVDLLRNGVSPDAIFEFLKLATNNSRVYKKIQGQKAKYQSSKALSHRDRPHRIKTPSQQTVLTERSSQMRSNDGEKQL